MAAAYSFADNPSNFMVYHTSSSSSSSQSDASIMAAISQHLLNQKQSLHHPSLLFCHDGGSIPMAEDPWLLMDDHQTNPTLLQLSLHCTTSRFASCSSSDNSDHRHAFGDFSSSSCFFEPTSVLDGHLSSPSLDSMRSPLSFTDQPHIHGSDRCLLEDAICLTVPSADDHCSILQRNEEGVLGRRGEMADIRSDEAAAGVYQESRQADGAGEEYFLDQLNELKLAMGGGDHVSSDWMDCLVNNLQEEVREVEIDSCFDQTNPCESARSSMEEESWIAGDFAFACSPASWRAPYPAFPPHPHASSSSSQDHHHLSQVDRHLLSQDHHHLSQVDRHLLSQDHHLHSCSSMALVDPYDHPPHENAGSIHPYQRASDAIDILSGMGVLGLHLQRKCGDGGILLLQTLIEFVRTVTRSTGSSSNARRSLACSNAAIKLQQMSSDSGDPLQRLSFYFTEAISISLQSIHPSPPPGLVGRDDARCPEDDALAYCTFDEACPYIKFAHLTANQAILEAAEAAEKIHIIDCGIVQGVQWAALLQAFATRHRPADSIPPKIRITGIAIPDLCPDPSSSLAATGKRLREFAMLLHLQLEFSPLCTSLEDLHPSMLRLESDELLAVNFMFQLHHLLTDDSLRHLQRALELVHLLHPAVITIAEFEASINTLPLHARFLNAFCLYAAIFDSMDHAPLARDDPDRIKVEKLFFGKEIRKMMAVDEAGERRESSENWRRLLERSGFWMKPLSWYATDQAGLLLWLYSDKFSLMEMAPGCLSLGWLDQPIITVSAWQC